MPTVIGIWNDALALLGQMPVNDITGTSDASRHLADQWTRVPNAILEEADWNSAITRVALSRLAEVPGHGHGYFYQLPYDLARICYLNDTGLEDDPFEAWRMEKDRIVTDADTIYLWYVSKEAQTNPAKWQYVLADYVSAEMAVRCAPRLAPKLLSGIMEIRDERRRKAKAIDGKNNPPHRHRPGRMVRARLGGLRGSTEQGR
jgi:hypothetical protein